jgi:two-component system LytT family response regulator
MIRCLVIDDEAGAVEILTRYVEKTPGLKLVKSFRSALEALSFLRGHEVDLIFLDIDMPELNGLRLGEMIDRRKTQLVYCTAYAEYAVQSYELEALDYLLKPIAFERFLKAVAKVPPAGGRTSGADKERPAPAAPSRIFVKSGAKVYRLNIRDLLYMEKDGHYVVFHTAAGECLSRMNMPDLLAALPEGEFARVHKSFVVALGKIDTIEKHTVIVRGKEIPIGDGFRAEFLRRIRTAGD